MNKKGNAVSNGRLIMNGSATGFIWHGSASKWGVYFNNSWTDGTNTEPNVFNGKTLKYAYITENGENHVKVYADSTLVLDVVANGSSTQGLWIGQSSSSFYDIVVTEARIYEQEVS